MAIKPFHEVNLEPEQFEKFYSGKTDWIVLEDTTDLDIRKGSVLLIHNFEDYSEAVIGYVAEVNQYPCYKPDYLNRIKLSDFYHLEIGIKKIEKLKVV